MEVALSQYSILREILRHLPASQVESLSCLNSVWSSACSATLEGDPGRQKIGHFNWIADDPAKIRNAKFRSHVKSSLHADLAERWRLYLETVYSWPGLVFCLSSLDLQTLSMPYETFDPELDSDDSYPDMEEGGPSVKYLISRGN